MGRSLCCCSTRLRLTEFVALDIGDARISARKGLLVVRSGKRDRYREVPLSRPVRDALEAWVKIRAKRIAGSEAALFVGPQGRRLSPRAVDMVIRNTARGAGLELSAHVLPHTCVTNLTTVAPTQSDAPDRQPEDSTVRRHEHTLHPTQSIIKGLAGCAAACVVALATLGAGSASAAVVAPGNLGGGAVLPSGQYGAGNVLITLCVTPDDRVGIVVDLQLSCAGETFLYIEHTLKTVAVIGPDSTFRATGTRRERGSGSDAKLAYEIAVAAICALA